MKDLTSKESLKNQQKASQKSSPQKPKTSQTSLENSLKNPQNLQDPPTPENAKSSEHLKNSPPIEELKQGPLDSQKDKPSSPEDLLKQAQENYLYLCAEFDNFKKKAQRERSDLIRYGAEKLAFDLLSALDIFQKALEVQVTAENFKSFVDGVHLTSKELAKTLEKHHIKEIPCLGKKFNPSVHEALSQIPSKDHDKNTVINVFKKGYSYKDKTLRHAQVVVSKGKEN